LLKKEDLCGNACEISLKSVYNYRQKLETYLSDKMCMQHIMTISEKKTAGRYK